MEKPKLSDYDLDEQKVRLNKVQNENWKNIKQARLDRKKLLKNIFNIALILYFIAYIFILLAFAFDENFENSVVGKVIMALGLIIFYVTIVFWFNFDKNEIDESDKYHYIDRKIEESIYKYNASVARYEKLKNLSSNNEISKNLKINNVKKIEKEKTFRIAPGGGIVLVDEKEDLE